MCFWLRRGCRKLRNTEQFLHQTNKNSDRRCSIKKPALKDFAIFTGKDLCWSLFLIKLPAFRSASLLEKDSIQRRCLGNFCWEIFKKIYFEECFWTDFKKWLFGTLFLDSRFQNYHASVISQNYQFLLY